MYRRLIAVGALATLTSGCSLVMVKGPPGYIPANDPVPSGACTSARTIPLIDAVGSVAGVATALTSSDGDAVRFGAVAGGALGFSSYTGFRRVGACRARMSPAPPVQGFALPARTVPGGPTLYNWPDAGMRPGDLLNAPRFLRPLPATPILSPDPGFLAGPPPRLQPLGRTSAPVRPGG